jgi:putative oxidoreductase
MVVNADLGLFILRVAAGAMLLTHGIRKLTDFSGTIRWLRNEGFPAPVLAGIAVTAAETIGALAVILGLWTRWAALIIAGSMLIAVLFHRKKRDPWNGMEDAALYLVVFVTLAIAGGGAWTLA